MSAIQKENPLDFKTQCGLGFDPQDDEIVVDFFCGGGGTGTGLEMGLGRPVTVTKNHSPAAISMHTANHPEGKAVGVEQKKTHKKLRIMLEVDGVESSLGALIRKILERNAPHGSPYLLLTDSGKRVTAPMQRHRWNDAREEAMKEAVAAGDKVLAGRISQFQFRDIRPKAASEITDVDHASLLLGHTKGDITERVYRRAGALAKPTK